MRARDDLAVRALNGDEEAWRLIVASVGPPVLAYARARGIRDPEDILGAVLLALHKALGRFTGDLGGIRALALKIARDRIADRYRRGAHQHEVAVAELPDQAGAADPSDATLEAAVVAELLQRLPETQREAVYLRVICDLPAEEVGRIIGKRAGAVRVMVFRALAEIRQQLGERAVTP